MGSLFIVVNAYPSRLSFTRVDSTGHASRRMGDHFPEDLVHLWIDWTVVLSGDVYITFIHLTTVCSY
jgi:hypothetical protein